MTYSTTSDLTPAQLDALSAFCAAHGLEARLGRHRCPWHGEQRGASLEVGLYDGRLYAYCWGACARREYLCSGDHDPTRPRRSSGNADAVPREPEPTRSRLRPALEVIRLAFRDARPGDAHARRCISPDVASRYWVQYVPADDRILVEHPDPDDRYERKTYVISDAWVIPITNESGDIEGIKVHRENPGDYGKSGWVRIGINRFGDFNDRNGYATLWPPPEWLGKPDFLDPDGDLSPEGQARRDALPQDKLAGLCRRRAAWLADLSDAYQDPPHEFLGRMANWAACRDWQAFDAEALLDDRPEARTLIVAPGELKALAYLSAGFHAVSPTVGDGMTWTPGLIRRLDGWRVVVAMDDDESGQGLVDALSEARERWGEPREVEYLSHGRKADGSKRDANDFECPEALRAATLGLLRGGQAS